jgi:mannitol operon transcriptional antiterminator
MELTPRIKQILQFVLEKNEPVLEQDIAQHIGVSKRTVQREFDYIAAGLVDYDLSLCKKKNIGVWIDGDAVNLNRLRKEVTETQNNNFSDKNTRRKYLIYELLREKIPKKLFYFSNLFGVSEATISHDLDVVEKKLAGYRLSLIRKPGFGVIVDGKEKDIRTALHYFVNDNMDDESMRSTA